MIIMRDIIDKAFGMYVANMNSDMWHDGADTWQYYGLKDVLLDHPQLEFYLNQYLMNDCISDSKKLDFMDWTLNNKTYSLDYCIRGVWNQHRGRIRLYDKPINMDTLLRVYLNDRTSGAQVWETVGRVMKQIDSADRISFYGWLHQSYLFSAPFIFDPAVPLFVDDRVRYNMRSDNEPPLVMSVVDTIKLKGWLSLDHDNVTEMIQDKLKRDAPASIALFRLWWSFNVGKWEFQL